MSNQKVISNISVPHFFKIGGKYDLEHIYEGGEVLKYEVRGYRGVAQYFDAKDFTIIQINKGEK